MKIGTLPIATKKSIDSTALFVKNKTTKTKAIFIYFKSFLNVIIHN